MKGGDSMKSTKNRIIAFVIGIVLTSLILSSSIFIAENSKHICTGNDCPICMEINQCENTINSLGHITFNTSFFWNIIVIFFTEIIFNFGTRTNCSTLITLKVELLS